MLPADRRPLDLRVSFEEVADEYAAARPLYPAALIDDVVVLANLPPEGSIFEIGCGTGQATLPLAQRGYHLTCVELGPKLAAHAAQKCRAYPKVQIHVGAFEEWEGPSGVFDLVMAATAFHWIAPAVGYPKAAQLLVPGGALALFSNEHPTPYSGFFAEVQAVYARLVPWWPSPQMASLDARIAETAATINATGLFKPAIVQTYGWTQTYTTAQYLRLLSTYSNYHSLQMPLREELYRAIAELIDRAYGGSIAKPYLSVLYLAPKR